MSDTPPSDRNVSPEGALRDQRDWLQITLSCVGDGVITADAEGRVNYLNPVAEKLTGWTLAAAAGKEVEQVFRIVNEETRKPIEQPVRKVIEHGLTVGLGNHTLLIARDGSERPIDDGSAAIKDDRGNVVGVVLIFRDITERRQAEQLIASAREYAESIVATVREPLLVLDNTLHVRSANRSFYEIFQAGPSEVVGRFIYDLGDGQWNIPRLRTLLESISPTNASFDDFEVEHDFEHIGPKTMLLNARRLPPGGAYDLILLAIEDITDRKRMSQAVTTSEIRYRRLFEAARDGILLLDPDTRKITDANPFMVDLLGYARDEFVGKELWEIGLLRDEQASREAFQVLQETGSIRYEDLPLESKTGMCREVEFVSNIYQEDGRPVIQCNIRDITERKRAEKAMRESEARLRAIFSGSLDGIVMVDDDGRYVEANPSACALFGLSKEELLGRRVPDFAEPGFPFDQAWQAFRGNGRSQGEFRLVRLDGTARDVEFAATADVLPGRHVSVLRDVTERKRLEEEAQRHDKELVEADRRKDEFLAMLGHELRNPLAPIRNALQLVRLSHQEPRQEVRQAYDIIERQVENMVRLVDDLLDVGRITSGKIQLQMERIDLAIIVARAIEGARPLIDARRHTLEVNLPEAPVPVEADPVRLAQVLWNLLNNAAKYTPDGGRITLEVERGEEAVVRIRDTGMGIAPEMLPRVFDLFTQMERTLDRAEGGLGLGLTLVRRLTEMHGGTVAATSAGEGQGSEFVVRLPVLPDVAPTVRPAKPALAERRVAPVSGRRILVVDDNRDSAESLAMLLRLFGNDVRTVQDGRLAVEMAAAYRPDVVLLDIGLPGLDGLEVCRRLRARTGEGQPLIVAMTGYGQEEDRRRSEEAGFDAHMVKPLDLEALQELLSRPELARHVPQGTRKGSVP